MEYKLIRSKRKTLSIQINKEAEIIVKAPINLPKYAIDEFVKSKEKWILEKLNMMKDFREKKVNFSLNYGDKVLFRGEEFTLMWDIKDKVYFENNFLYMPSNLTADEVKYNIIKLYKLHAKKILNEKVNHYKYIMNVSPIKIKINSASTRWGSCSLKGSLNFSWKIMFAKDEIIDYIVVHELAHLKEHNHSKDFWNEVFLVLPDYKLRQRGLSEIENKLRYENWDQ